jgi:hypothetical protein
MTPRKHLLKTTRGCGYGCCISAGSPPSRIIGANRSRKTQRRVVGKIVRNKIKADARNEIRDYA